MSGGGAGRAGEGGNVFFLSQDTASRLRHGQVGEDCRALLEEGDQAAARARERAADHPVEAAAVADAGQLGPEHLELHALPGVRRVREEAVEEVEVLRDDQARQPSPEHFRAAFAAQVAVAAVHAREGPGSGRHAHVGLGQQLALGAFCGRALFDEAFSGEMVTPALKVRIETSF